MYSKIAVTVVTLFTIAFLVGCAASPKLYRTIPFPINKIISPGPVLQILISAQPKGKIAVGQPVVLTAQAVDENARKVAVKEFTWACDAAGELSATKGKSVTFKLLKKPDVACFVTATADGVEGIIAIEGK